MVSVTDSVAEGLKVILDLHRSELEFCISVKTKCDHLFINLRKMGLDLLY